jgi:hypothetical protein
MYGKGRSGVVPSSCVELRGFSGWRGAGAAFGRVKSAQARAKCVDYYRTHDAIAEFDLGHQVSGVIPRSWSIPYIASAFWFEKIVQPTNLPVQKKEKKRIDLFTPLIGFLSEWTRCWVCGRWIDSDDQMQ